MESNQSIPEPPFELQTTAALAAEERMAELEARVFQLENLVEAYIWCYQTRELDTPTLTVAIRKAIGEYFKVTQHEITGANQLGNGRGQGYALRNKSAYDLKLQQVRDWIVLLMRQCCQAEQPQLKDIYPWCFRSTYKDAYNKLGALYRQPNHPDRAVWLKLLALVRDKAAQIGAETREIDNELNRVS